jgi:hypothetical protein
MLAVERGQIAWIRRPGIGALFSVAARVQGGWLPFIIVCAAAGWAVRQRANGTESTVLVAGALLPFLGLWTVSQAKPVFVDRYLIASLGAGVLLLACALARPHALAVVCTGALVLAGLIGEAQLEARPFKVQDPRAAAQFIAARRLPGDAVVGDDGLWAALGRYLPAPPSGTAASGRVWVVSEPEALPAPAPSLHAALQHRFGRLQVVLWSN